MELGINFFFQDNKFAFSSTIVKSAGPKQPTSRMTMTITMMMMMMRRRRRMMIIAKQSI